MKIFETPRLAVSDVPPSALTSSAVAVSSDGVERLDADQVRELRDALTVWLERVGRG